MRFVICNSCGYPQRTEKEEGECIYCGGDLLQSKVITERIWREYWIGMWGQPFGYRDIKSSKQTTLLGVRK